jgi:uncharacterized membrane protein HdeD (DUF308 family)
MNELPFSRTTSIFVIRGLASLLLGAAAFTRPEANLEVLVRLIGGYVAVVGIVAVVGAIKLVDEAGTRRPVLALGVLDLGLGIAVFAWPGASAIALLWPVAVTLWAVLGGIAQFVIAGQFNCVRASRILLRTCGLFTIVFGVALAVVALPGTQPIVWLVGGHAVVAAALMLGVAISVWRSPGLQDQPAG